MSAPMTFDLETAQPVGKATPTPADLAITPRDQRFCRDRKPGKYWLAGDPLATAWHNALSITFPKGEAFFIEAVKAHREGAPPKLEMEIRAFIRQEINHTREHVAFNRAVLDAGYDVSNIEARVDALLAMTKERPAIVNLAATMALEHFTAMMAHEFLRNPKHFEGATGETAAMWRWHAVEEIEHKGVAFDTWLHATSHWSRFKRWKVKCLMMLIVTRHFIAHRIEDTLELLAQDRLTGTKWKLRLLAYLLWQPGILRRIFPAWIAYFMPRFHPWNADDRALIGKYDSEFAYAAMPA